jgi:hypothetical protein
MKARKSQSHEALTIYIFQPMLLLRSNQLCTVRLEEKRSNSHADGEDVDENESTKR